MTAAVVVWVLVLWTGNGPVVVDNIASEGNCRAFVREYARLGYAASGGTCIPVRKVFVR